MYLLQEDNEEPQEAVANTWWQLTIVRVTEEEHNKTGVDRGPFIEPVVFNICWNLSLVRLSENITPNSLRHWEIQDVRIHL